MIGVSELVKSTMIRFLTVMVFCLNVFFAGYAQQGRGVFQVSGKIKVDQGMVDGTRIEVYRNGALLQNMAINRTGNFVVTLDLDQIYRFIILNDGYYSKSVEIDTHVPAEVCSENCIFPPYQLAILIYKNVPGVTESKQQVGRISYNPKVDNFDAEILREKSDISNLIESVIDETKDKCEKYESQKVGALNAKYNSFLREGDRLLALADYENAMLKYRDAVLLKMNEKYPRERIDYAYQIIIRNELTKTFGAPDNNNLLKYINYGDLKLKEREYTVAKVAFKQALSIKTDDQQLADKIQTCDDENKKLVTLVENEVVHKNQVYVLRTKKYNELVTQGDMSLKNEDVAKARDYYGQAVTQINENSYALGMLKKIDEIFDNSELALKLARERDEAEKKRLQEARKQAYKDAVKEADLLFNQRLYRDAIEYYELALTIQSWELYPKKQIIDINDILAKLQLQGGEYNRLLLEGEGFVYDKEYIKGRESYVKAHKLIPDEKFALQKIKEIDMILERLKAEEQFQTQYDEIINAADILYNENKLNEALSEYQKASLLKPSESYPKERIVYIRGILSRESEDQKRLMQLQNDYDKLISQADGAFFKQSYLPARSLYQRALQLIPEQDYPQVQIKKIDDIISKQNSPQSKPQSKLEEIDFANLDLLSIDERKEAYKEAMALGEQFIKSEEWGVARFYFRRALALIPGDGPATSKLNEVEKMVRGTDINESKYAELVKKAEESFKTGDINVSKFYFTKALEAKPGDTYVRERLKVVEQLTSTTISRSNSKEYDEAMNKGNEAYNTGNYSVARFFYRKALGLKSNDGPAKEKIELVENAMNQTKASSSDSQFDRNISLGDAAFNQKRFAIAINYYKQALMLKPSASYPTSQISKIEGLMKEQK